MQMMIQKARNDENIIWVFCGIADFARAKLITPDMVSLRALEGKLPSAGGKGLLDLLIYKKQMLQFITGECLQKINIRAADRSKIQEVCSSHKTFRKHVGYKDSSSWDLSWKAGWPASSDAALALAEDRTALTC